MFVVPGVSDPQYSRGEGGRVQEAAAGAALHLQALRPGDGGHQHQLVPPPPTRQPAHPSTQPTTHPST